jgi:hypothetical protein
MVFTIKNLGIWYRRNKFLWTKISKSIKKKKEKEIGENENIKV